VIYTFITRLSRWTTSHTNIYIYVKRYLVSEHTQTHRHTDRTYCSIWTSEVVDKINFISIKAYEAILSFRAATSKCV